MNRFQKGLLSSSWEFSIALKFPEISVGIKIELFGTAGNFPGKVIHLQRWFSPAGPFRPKLTVLQKFLLPTLLVLRWEIKTFGRNVTGTRSSGRRHCLNQTVMFLFLLVGSSGALSIQQKSQFEISEISRVQWSCTFRLHRPDPSHRAFGYCSCKQDAKERYWGQQFCQMERDISVQPTQMSGLVKVDHLQSWSRVFRSDQTEMVRSIWRTNRNYGNFGLNGKRPCFLVGLKKIDSTLRLQDRFHVTS